jgi:hypothetical protein
MGPNGGAQRRGSAHSCWSDMGALPVKHGAAPGPSARGRRAAPGGGPGPARARLAGSGRPKAPRRLLGTGPEHTSLGPSRRRVAALLRWVRARARAHGATGDGRQMHGCIEPRGVWRGQTGGAGSLPAGMRLRWALGFGRSQRAGSIGRRARGCIEAQVPSAAQTRRYRPRWGKRRSWASCAVLKSACECRSEAASPAK